MYSYLIEHPAEALYTIIAGLFVAAVAAALGVLLSRWLSSLLLPKAITEPDDPDLIEFYNLIDNALPNEPRITYDDARRWLREANDETDRLVDFHLVLKCRGRIVTALNAQLYFLYPYIFISYLAIDENNDAARSRGASDVIKYLSKKCATYSWDTVLAEVSGATGSLMFRTLSLALRKMPEFRDYSVFKIEMEYFQPALRPEGAVFGVTHSDPSAKKWLIYLSRVPNPNTRRNNGNFYLRENEIKRILTYILRFVYGEAHYDSTEYQEYLEKELAHLINNLDGDVRLLTRIGV